MMNDNLSKPTAPAKQPGPATPVENSTDATRGEPLALRAQKRKAELEAILEKLPADDLRTRNDVAVAVASFKELLTGDVDRLSEATAAQLSRLLEGSKHLAEVTPAASAEPAGATLETRTTATMPAVSVQRTPVAE
jgi:hypothetical protein